MINSTFEVNNSSKEPDFGDWFIEPQKLKIK